MRPTIIIAKYITNRERWKETEQWNKFDKDKDMKKKEKYIAKDANDVNSIEKYGIECAFTQNPHIHIKMASHQRSEKNARRKRKINTHTYTRAFQKKPLQYNQRSIRNIQSKEIM